MKTRPTAVEIPLHKMCKVTTVRIVSAAEAEHLCGGIGNAQYDVIMKKGDKVRLGKLDIAEPDPTRLLQNVCVLRPQSIVYAHLKETSVVKPRDISDIFHFQTAKVPDDHNFPLQYPFSQPILPNPVMEREPKRRRRELAALGDGSLLESFPSGRK
jgi:hypothetical protein